VLEHDKVTRVRIFRLLPGLLACILLLIVRQSAKRRARFGLCQTTPVSAPQNCFLPAALKREHHHHTTTLSRDCTFAKQTMHRWKKKGETKVILYCF
jgi:hypothetical protein